MTALHGSKKGGLKQSKERCKRLLNMKVVDINLEIAVRFWMAKKGKKIVNK